MGMVGVAVLLLVATGIAGVGRGTFRLQDFTYLYGGGATWRVGESPYNDQQLRERTVAALAGTGQEHAVDDLSCAFVYPPPASGLMVPLASLPLRAALLGFGAINLISVGVIAGLAVTALRRSEYVRASGRAILLSGLGIAFVVGSPFVSHNIWMGQSSLLAVGLVSAACVAHSRGRPVLAGALAALTAAKPTLTIFYLLYLALVGGWRTWLAMGTVGIVLSLWAASVDGPVGMASAWWDAVHRYREARQNEAIFRHSYGLESLLATLGLSGFPAGIVGVIAFGGLLALRKRVSPFEAMAVSLSIALLFIRTHDYDLAAAAPLFIVLIVRSANSWLKLGVLCFLVAAIYIPLRFVERLETPILERYREVLHLALFAWWWVEVFRHPVPNAERAPETPQVA